MRILLLLAVLFLTTVASHAASSDGGNPQTVDPHPSRHAAQKEESEANKLPLLIRGEITTKKDEAEAKEDAQERIIKTSIDHALVKYTKLLAIFTGLLFLFTAVLCWVTFRLSSDGRKTSERQALETQRSLNLAEKATDLAEKQLLLQGLQTDIIEKQKEIGHQQFLAMHRPRVILREAYAIKDEGNPIVVHYTLANTGGVATRIIESSLAVTYVQIERLHKGPDFVGKNELGDITIKAGAHEVCEYAAPMKWRDGGVVLSGDWGYFFSGHVVYEDNGVMRHTAFFRRYDSATSRFVPINDPQLEYCDDRA